MPKRTTGSSNTPKSGPPSQRNDRTGKNLKRMGIGTPRPNGPAPKGGAQR